MLLVGLVVLAVIPTLIDAAPGARGWWSLPVGLALVAVYLWGRLRLRIHERPVAQRNASWWPEGAWMLVLVLVWLALLAATPRALWVAFPLMLIQLHVLGPRAGIPAVALTVLLAVAEGLLRRQAGEAWTGFVLGPAIGGLVAIGFALGLEAIVSESQQRARALAELTAARALLAESEREHVTAVERERLAREIHDTLAQGLSGIELLLRAAQDAADAGTDDAATGATRSAALVAQARQVAQQNLAEARRVVAALAPPDLADSTLTAALGRVTERSASPALATHLHVVGPTRPLPLPVETALVRLTQSALANVVQHANASRVDVTLTFGEDDVLLDVVDDGCGFRAGSGAPTSSGGYGLRAMRSRVAELGGTLVLESAPGDGTALAVALPVDRATGDDPRPGPGRGGQQIDEQPRSEEHGDDG